MAVKNFKLVPKIEGNEGAIYIVIPNGDSRMLCHVLFPADQQLNDNVLCLNDMMVALRKRIRKSM